MASLPVQVAVNCEKQRDNALTSVKVGVKRKRTPSSGEEEGEKTECKKEELVNGPSTAVASQAGHEEEEKAERVVILDAGAQYGKVGFLYEYSLAVSAVSVV